MPRFILEARDQLYNRVGLVENYMSFEAILRLNAPGSWTLTIPAGAPEVAVLKQGCGLIAHIEGQEDVAFSGPITSISYQWDASAQGAGTVTVSGVTDEQLLWERLAYPIPDKGLDEQTDDRWILLGNAQVLMESLVRDNCGSTALEHRRYPELDFAPSDEPLGTFASVSTRFDILGEKLKELADSQGLAFQIRQNKDDDRLVFRVFQPEDKRDLVFSKTLGNLQGFSYDIASPSATRVVFACQGEGKFRYFHDVDFSTGVVSRWDDRDSRLTYTGNWVQQEDPDAYSGTLTRSSVLGDDFTLTFSGTGIRLYGMREDNPSASGSYSIDGGPVTTFPLTGVPPETPRQLLLELTGLPRTTHQFAFEAVYWVWIDYIEIIDEELQSGGEWAHRGERFYDRRDIPVAWNSTHTSLIDPSNNNAPANASVYLPLIEQATLEAWDDVGARSSLSMTPIDTELAMYGRDYRLGDIVTVDINGQQVTDILREVRLSDGDEGPRVTPTIGDPQATSTPGLYTTIRRLWSRMRKLEAQ